MFDLNSQPVASVPVLVSGKTSTNTDASGTFTVTSVTVPYDVTVIVAASQGALMYKGVSDDVILSQLIASGSSFQLTTGDIIDLEKARVSEKVITAMIRTGEASDNGSRLGPYYRGYSQYAYPLYTNAYLWYPSLFFGF